MTKDGETLEGLDIDGNLDIKANNVTVQRSRITAGNYYPVRVYPGFTGFRLIDSEVVGVNAGANQCSVAVTGGNVTLTRVDIHNCADGVHPGNDSTVEDSYIHALWLGTDASGARVVDTHNDGIQLLGGTHFVIRHNRIEIGHNQNAAVFVKADFGAITDVQIAGNYLDGGSYTIFGADARGGAVERVSITDNVFGPSRLFGMLFTSKWSGPTVVEGNTTTSGGSVTQSQQPSGRAATTAAAVG